MASPINPPSRYEAIVDPKTGTPLLQFSKFLENLNRMASADGADAEQLLASLQSEAGQLLALVSVQAGEIRDLNAILANQIAQHSALVGQLEGHERRIADLEQLVAASTSPA